MIPPIIYFGIDVLIRVLDKRSIDYFEIVVVLIYIVFCVSIITEYSSRFINTFVLFLLGVCCTIFLLLVGVECIYNRLERDLISFMERENRKEIKPKLVIARY